MIDCVIEDIAVILSALNGIGSEYLNSEPTLLTKHLSVQRCLFSVRGMTLMSSSVHRSAISIEEIICVVAAMNGFGCCPACTTISIVFLVVFGNKLHEQCCYILCTVCFYHMLFSL